MVVSGGNMRDSGKDFLCRHGLNFLGKSVECLTTCTDSVHRMPVNWDWPYPKLYNTNSDWLQTQLDVFFWYLHRWRIQYTPKSEWLFQVRKTVFSSSFSTIFYFDRQFLWLFLTKAWKPLYGGSESSEKTKLNTNWHEFYSLFVVWIVLSAL